MDWLSILILASLAVVFILLWRREIQARLDLSRKTRQQIQQFEKSLQAQEAEHTWLAAALDSTADALIVADRDLSVRYANAVALALFGKLDEGATLISFSRDLEVEQLAKDAMDVGAAEGLERRITIEERPYRACASVFNEGVSLALTDVYEMQRLSRARQDMVTNLSHELRTPLTSLRFLADTLSETTGEDPEVSQELLEKMIAEVDTLDQISNEMLDLAAIESGRQVVRLEPLKLADVLEDPVIRLADQARRKEQRILVEVPATLEILGDRDQAGRAVRNVLDNAIKYTPEGKDIHISARIDEPEQLVILSIQDSGPGLHPDELERIFERFYRGDLARGTPGTGLGLAIARHIVRAHGGRIWAENRAPPDSGAILHLAFQQA